MSKRKDPAFLWYPDEWIGGTRLMDFAHMGAYMECLMMQYKNGHLSTDQIKIILKSDYHLWETGVKDKFEIDDNGLYYNDKLDRVVEERRKYKDGRIENLKGHKEAHMDAPYETPICRDRDRDRDRDRTDNIIETDISNLLYSLIKNRNPGHKEPNIHAWAKHIDLMIRADKRKPDEIKAVINWCQADSFWQNNILSTAKLREKYDQLVLKMKSTSTTSGGIKPDLSKYDKFVGVTNVKLKTHSDPV